MMLSLRWQDSFGGGGGGDDRRFKGEGFRSSLRFDLEKNLSSILEDFCTESCLASETDHLLVDTIESRVLSNKEGESSLSESKWLEHDESLAVWVKCRGKWQAPIKCARADWPLSTVKAKPTHDRKKYLAIFFPRKRNYSWADVLLVRPINEFPEPIAYRTHKVGMKMVKDLTLVLLAC